MPQYQGVWTLQQQAQAQSNQQWVTDPNFKNTTLLLQADGTGSGSQNQTFLDGSTNNFFITRNGNTTQGSFSPFSQAPGYWGVYNTIGSYCQLNNADYAIGTGDFTIEFWMYCVDDTSYGSSAFAGLPGGGVLTVSMSSGSSNARQPYLEFGGVSTAFGTLRDYLNKWTHIAYVRSSGSVVVYQNGIATASPISRTQSFPNCANLYLARLPTDTNQDFRGYLSNFRITKSAVYTSNFTPSTLPLTTTSQGATSCQLLTFQNNRFIDNSSNASTVTPTNTSIQTFSPFVPTQQWTPDVVSGSMCQDSSGDYLSFATNTSAFQLGSGDWSVEGWVYSISSSVSYLMSGQTDQTTIAGSSFLVGYNGESCSAFSGGSRIDFTFGQLDKYAWTHLVFCRSGSTISCYKNGVRIGTGTFSGTINNGATNYPPKVGAGGSTTGTEQYLSNVRIVKGSSPYNAASSTITVPTAPVTAITNTALLLNYTNAGIYDGKMANVLETVGNAQVSTSVVKYGSGSMYFDGSGDYLVFPTNPNYEIGSGDFTIECWVYGVVFSSSNGGSGIFGKGNTSSLSGEVYVLQCNNGTLGFYAFASANTYTSPVASGPFNLQTNTWNHVAVTKANGITRVFVNGISGTSSSLAYTVATGGSFYVGTQPYSPTDTTRELNGYVDDLRITKGVARYIANFTPPQQALPRQ